MHFLNNPSPGANSPSPSIPILRSGEKHPPFNSKAKVKARTPHPDPSSASPSLFNYDCSHPFAWTKTPLPMCQRLLFFFSRFLSPGQLCLRLVKNILLRSLSLGQAMFSFIFICSVVRSLQQLPFFHWSTMAEQIFTVLIGDVNVEPRFFHHLFCLVNQILNQFHDSFLALDQQTRGTTKPCSFLLLSEPMFSINFIVFLWCVVSKQVAANKSLF